MMPNVARPPRIDISEVKAAAKARMRENGNYRRVALMLALMMLLINVPVLLMDYLSTGFIDLGQLDTGALSMLNLRLMLFQLLMSLLISPAFELSKTRYMLRTMRDRAGSPNELFDGLGRGSYFVSVRAALWKGLMMYVWLMIPLGMMSQGLVATLYGGSGGLGLALIGAALMAFIAVNRMLAYSLQFYFLAEQPRVGAIMSLRLSTMTMRGRMWERLKLELRLLAYILPPMLPNIASMLFLKDSAAFGIAMSICTIALWAVCYPVVESAMAEYFLRIKAQLEEQAAQARRAHESAWADASADGARSDSDDDPNT